MSACSTEASQVQHTSAEEYGLACSQACALQYSSGALCSRKCASRLSVSSNLMLMYRVSESICPDQLKIIIGRMLMALREVTLNPSMACRHCARASGSAASCAEDGSKGLGAGVQVAQAVPG